MSEKSTPSAILPTPLRETALAYLGGVFFGIDLVEKYVLTPLRSNVERIARVIGRGNRIALRGRRTRRHAR